MTREPCANPLRVSITGAGTKRFVLRRKAKEEPARGKIDLLLLSEYGLEALKGVNLDVTGEGVKLQGKTDDEGRYRGGQVAPGEYILKVGGEEIAVPALAEDDEEPFAVHVPFSALPDRPEPETPAQGHEGGW
jgi:hypothetical protein